MEQYLYTVDEASRLVNVCRSTIYEEIRKNRLTARKFGRKTIIAADELKRWANELPKMGAQQ